MGAPLMLNGTAVMLDAMLTGPGLNSSNNRSLYLNDAFGLTARYSTGVPVAALNGACISKWTDVVQAISGQGLHAMVVSLKQGVANVTADTDSGLLVADKTNTFDQEVEGKSAADGAMLGQFTGRIAQSTFAVTFTSFLQTEPSSNMALLKLIPGLNPTKLMRRSDEIVETPGLKPVVNTLLGETVAEDTDVLWRASLRTGSQEVTTANNEGLWSDRFDAQKLVVRKGDPLPGALGATLTFDRFLKFWAINNNRVMFLAKLKGRGVNASNDCALFVSQGDESMMLLVREGDAAPEGGGATIGVIQRIEVDTVQGRYAVLCSLAKCASSSNQALYLGRINSGNTTTQSASRLPFLGLRKGSLYQGSLGSTTTLRSMSLPATSNDATGAGSKGYSRAINASGELVLPILFNNNALQIMRGSP
ncbi:MAG: hypothetical protein KDK97_02100 [Verrucomicrobiales bacterium]|nr:hypothetical protein [Verrucomicrobiales bacterium]